MLHTYRQNALTHASIVVLLLNILAVDNVQVQKRQFFFFLVSSFFLPSSVFPIFCTALLVLLFYVVYTLRDSIPECKCILTERRAKYRLQIMLLCKCVEYVIVLDSWSLRPLILFLRRLRRILPEEEILNNRRILLLFLV